MATISKQLRRAIRDSGRVPAEIARAAGVTKATLSRFLNGKNMPRLDVADRLAAELNLMLAAKPGKQAKQPKAGGL